MVTNSPGTIPEVKILVSPCRVHSKIETEEPELAEAVQYLGAEHFLFATDYPHDDPGGRMKYKDVELLRDNPRITEDAKEIIRYKSAAAMLPAVA